MTIFTELGGLIREARESAPKKMTQAQLAEALGEGWYQTTISMIESGKERVHLDDIERIAGILGKDALEMITEAYRRYRRGK